MRERIEREREFGFFISSVKNDNNKNNNYSKRSCVSKEKKKKEIDGRLRSGREKERDGTRERKQQQNLGNSFLSLSLFFLTQMISISQKKRMKKAP